MLNDIKFTKMQSNGNDYIYFDCFHHPMDIERIKPYIKNLCNRHIGIGADGVIFILPSTVASAKMIMYNKDATEASMCANGIRCVSKYLYDNKLVSSNSISIETKSGIYPILLHIKGGTVHMISIQMGKPKLDACYVPVYTDKCFFMKQPIIVDKIAYETTCVSVGNPHAVIFNDDAEQIDVESVGSYLSCHHLFPEGVNVDFVEQIDTKSIYLKTWERGSGLTLSSGSGACAAVVASVVTDRIKMNEKINVLEPGGVEKVEYNSKKGLILDGEASFVYEGKIPIKTKKKV